MPSYKPCPRFIFFYFIQLAVLVARTTAVNSRSFEATSFPNGSSKCSDGFVMRVLNLTLSTNTMPVQSKVCFPSASYCAWQCFLESSCYHFNYIETTAECQLFNSTAAGCYYQEDCSHFQIVGSESCRSPDLVPVCGANYTSNQVSVGDYVQMTCSVAYEGNRTLVVVWTDSNGETLSVGVTTTTLSNAVVSSVAIRILSQTKYYCSVSDQTSMNVVYSCSTPDVNITSPCPTDFEAVFEEERILCFRLFYGSVDWDSAIAQCQQLYNGSHLVVIKNSRKQAAVVEYLQTALNRSESVKCIDMLRPSYGKLIWSSGVRANMSDCGKTFVWEPVPGGKTTTVTFANWQPKQPNCYAGLEHCIMLSRDQNYGWNDFPCTEMFCALCEFRLP